MEVTLSLHFKRALGQVRGHVTVHFKPREGLVFSGARRECPTGGSCTALRDSLQFQDFRPVLPAPHGLKS